MKHARAVLSVVLVASSFGCGLLGNKSKDGPDAATSATAAATSASAAPTAVPSARAGVALPGECVDTIADAKKRSKSKTDPKGTPKYDLDDDGTNDAVHYLGGRYWVYIMRGACGHFVGDFSAPFSWSMKPTKTSGLHDLEADIGGPSLCDDVCKGCDHEGAPVVFDGTTYKTGKSKTIPNPECKKKPK